MINLNQRSRWKEDVFDYSKPSKAVLCSNGRTGIILYYVGATLSFEVEEMGLTFLEDLGLGNAPKGISIWEGDYKWYPGSWEYSTDGDYIPEGKFRQPTEEEWSDIKQNKCPWDEKDWLLERGIQNEF